MLPGDFEGALAFIERFVDVGLIPISIASVVMMAGGAIGALSDAQVKINEAKREGRKSLETMARASVFLEIAGGLVIVAFILFVAFSPQRTLDRYSWEQLADISSEISAAGSEDEALLVAKEHGLLDARGRLDGSQAKTVKLKDGTVTSVQLIGIYHDDVNGDGRKAGLTFAFTDAVAEHAMNYEENTNRGGWADSNMREWLNTELFDWLPDDLRAEIETVIKWANYIDPVDGSDRVSFTQDKLWLLSVSECVGDPRGCDVWTGEYDYLNDIANAEGRQYKLFQDAAISPKRNNGLLLREFVGEQSSSGNIPGTACQWWLRSPSSATSDSFASEFAGDEPDGATEAVAVLGVAPCFCI